jgi:hypothetical protein
MKIKNLQVESGKHESSLHPIPSKINKEVDFRGECGPAIDPKS